MSKQVLDTEKQVRTRKRRALTEDEKKILYDKQKQYRREKKLELQAVKSELEDAETELAIWKKRVAILEHELLCTRLALRIVRNIPFGTLPSDVPREVPSEVQISSTRHESTCKSTTSTSPALDRQVLAKLQTDQL